MTNWSERFFKPEFRKVFEKRYYSCHCESRVWVSFFRHEEAHAPLPVNGEDGVPLMAEPPGSSVKSMHSRLPSSLPEKGHPYPGLSLAKFGLSDRDERAKDEAMEAGEVRSAAVEKVAATPPEKEARQKEKAGKEVAGYYIVKKGEGLSGIASRGDVHGDPLKWPFLCRRNLDKLTKLPLGKLLPDSKLPEGLRLKIVSLDEVRENLRTRRQKPWVVNVVSTTTSERINPFAVNLIINGYLVYITRAKVKGRDWTRLRVGFFKDRTDADKQGERIMAMLNLTDSWVTKVEKEELEEFGGY